eukprot:972141_1
MTFCDRFCTLLTLLIWLVVKTKPVFSCNCFGKISPLGQRSRDSNNDFHAIRTRIAFDDESKKQKATRFWRRKNKTRQSYPSHTTDDSTQTDPVLLIKRQHTTSSRLLQRLSRLSTTRTSATSKSHLNSTTVETIATATSQDAISSREQRVVVTPPLTAHSDPAPSPQPQRPTPHGVDGIYSAVEFPGSNSTLLRWYQRKNFLDRHKKAINGTLLTKCNSKWSFWSTLSTSTNAFPFPFSSMTTNGTGSTATVDTSPLGTNRNPSILSSPRDGTSS